MFQKSSITSSPSPLAEMKRPKARHETISETLKCSSDNEWDTFKAQLLSKISSTINPQTLSYDDFNVTCLIPHIIDKPGTPLKNTSNYQIVTDAALNAKKLPLISITIEGKVVDVVDADDKEDKKNDKNKGGSKKSKVSICSHVFAPIGINHTFHSIEKEGAHCLPN